MDSIGVEETTEGLGEQVGDVVVGGNMDKQNLPFLDTLMDVVVMDVDVLHV